MTSIPLVRLLTDAGYGSRREASQLVKKGLVQINGRIASSYTETVDPAVDGITVTGKSVASRPARRVYFVMNKPEGYLCTTEDDRGRPTVMDLLPQHMRSAGLHPAGRLDEDTTGLLILTNDGQLTYELTHPRYEHEKEYYVATTGRLTDAEVEKLEQGVEIEGQKTWPARMRLLLGQSPYTYSITIHEGRKRQIRLMFAAIGQQVAMLKRVRMGGLLLDDLEEGKWRELTPQELRKLMRGSAEMRTSRAAARVRSPYGERTRGAYGSTGRSSRGASGPPGSPASPSESRTRSTAPRRDVARSTGRLEAETRAPRSRSGTIPPATRRPTSFGGAGGSQQRERRYTDKAAPRPERQTGGPDTRPTTRRDAPPEQRRTYRPSSEERSSRPPDRRQPGNGPTRPYRRTEEGPGSRPSTQREVRPARRDSGRSRDERHDSSRHERWDTNRYERDEPRRPRTGPPRRTSPARSESPDAGRRRNQEGYESPRQRTRDDQKERQRTTTERRRSSARPDSETPRAWRSDTRRPPPDRRPRTQR